MRVKLIYLKPNGTYYAEGEYQSKYEFPWDVREEVYGLRLDGNLPELVKGSYDWHILIECPEYEHDVPTLLPLCEGGSRSCGART